MTTPLQSSLEDVGAGSSASLVVHTPGPWKAVMQFGEWFVRQDPTDWDGNGYQHICSLAASKKGTYYGDMFAANARLISAAPDLLHAAKEVARRLGHLENEMQGRITGDVATRFRSVRINIMLLEAAILKATSSSSERSEAAPTQDTEGGK